MVDQVLLSEAEAATFLGVSKTAIAKWRLRGEGPEHTIFGNTKNGKIKYRLDHLEAFIKVRQLARTQSMDDYRRKHSNNI